MAMTFFLIASVGPDFSAVSGSSQLRSIIGALLTYGLIIAVLMVIVCAATWAVGSAHGSWQTTTKAKAGLFVALGGAVLTGGALAWANWLLRLGATL
jgi:type IV secretory pathway VirB2 component (pilin)